MQLTLNAADARAVLFYDGKAYREPRSPQRQATVAIPSRFRG